VNVGAQERVGLGTRPNIKRLPSVDMGSNFEERTEIDLLKRGIH
jgi:hypothetical protein